MNHMPVQHYLISAMVVAVCATSIALADTLEVPSPFLTIQEAIDAAAGGDMVLVADGTYTGEGYRDLDFGGKAITVRSENGAGACVIDIQGSDLDPHRAFHFHNGETAASIVEGFTIQNGFMDRGGAVLCEDGSSPLFQSCIFQQNSVSQAVAEDGGGAVYNLGSSPTFAYCDFVGNHAEANFLFGGGGAVHNQSDSSPTFIGCTFDQNMAIGSQEPDGGAVAIWDGGHPEFYSCTFTDNHAYWDAAVFNLSSVTMHDCVFQGNQTTGAAAGAYGQIGGGNSELVNCSFIGNSTTGNSGGAVVVQHPGTSASFTNCIFEDNAAAGHAGGMWVGQDAEAVVINCLFQGNQASNNGGAIFIRQAQASLTNCLFQENLANNNGGAIRAALDSLAQIDNCTFAQNVAANQGGGIGLSATADNVTVSNSILWNNAPQQIVWTGGLLSVTYSDIQGGWAGEGNIDADPLFPIDGVYVLGASSPCIDAGDNTSVPEGITIDLDGDPRFQNDLDTADTGNGSCPIVDMGSYEYPTTCPADINCDESVDITDLLDLLANWGPCPGCAADMDGDGIVGVTDLLALLAAWGAC